MRKELLLGPESYKDLSCARHPFSLEDGVLGNKTNTQLGDDHLERLRAAGTTVGGKVATAVEELVSGVRQVADFEEQFRSYSESEKQWKAHMEFILRHLPDYCNPPNGGGRLDQLMPFFMVWANHLFLGCSYNKDLLDKVMGMADGMEVEDLPQFTTRRELMKKHQR
ncbi:CDKN2AIP N-terminal-like protein [Pongo abelii]|uniref:CDKN2AIP N-terminal-like protein n=1 Tax=Pongo abelii TaxID=9601 RepID=UPI0001D5D98D|nr:CDKN2AIP N-terminal-like protein [Pongo abelii]